MNLSKLPRTLALTVHAAGQNSKADRRDDRAAAGLSRGADAGLAQAAEDAARNCARLRVARVHLESAMTVGDALGAEELGAVRAHLKGPADALEEAARERLEGVHASQEMSQAVRAARRA